MEKLEQALAIQLWGNQLGGDANDKAAEMMPWLLAHLDEAELRGYQRGIDEAFRQVNAKITPADYTDPDRCFDTLAAINDLCIAKLEALRGGEDE